MADRTDDPFKFHLINMFPAPLNVIVEVAPREVDADVKCWTLVADNRFGGVLQYPDGSTASLQGEEHALVQAIDRINESLGRVEPNVTLMIRCDALIEASGVQVVIAEMCDVLIEMFTLESDLFWLTECTELLVVFVTPAGSSFGELREAMRRQRELSLEHLVEVMLAERVAPDRDDRTRWLPSLIAVPYTLVDAPQPSAQSKWSAARATAESVMQYVAYVALAPPDVAARAEQIRRIAQEFETTRPSLGRFARIVESRRQSVTDRFPTVGSVLWSARGRRTKLGEFVFDRLVNLRNREHHGGAPSEGDFVEMYQELRPALDEVLTALSRDSRSVVPVVQNRMEFAEQSEDSFDYWLTELRGNAIVLPSSPVVSRARLMRKHVYLSMPNDEFLDLDPLIVFDSCPTCRMSEAFLLDRFEPDAPLWRNARGHEIKG